MLDFFKSFTENSEFNTKSISTLQIKYENISDHSYALFQKLLGKLADFDELMRLDNSRPLNPKHQQSANDLFNDVALAINDIEQMRYQYSEKSEVYDICTSAIEYSNGLIDNHLMLLKKNKPQSVLLTWYQEHQTNGNMDYHS